MTQITSIKQYFSSDAVQNKFKELLGNKSQGFITSVLQVVNSNNDLAQAEPQSVFGAAAAAAVLDLPINNNLGFAYIIAYNQKGSDGNYRKVAQFQIGYKGFIQLAQRSGQFKTISAAPIYEGQLISQDSLKGYEFDFTKKTSEKVIGYAAYFSLLNGFEKVHYMTLDEINKHAKKYSKTFGKSFGVWKDDFEAMACKTVIKLLLSKFAPLSIEMQRAVVFDQANIKDAETQDVEYVDNDKEAAIAQQKEAIKNPKTLELP